MLMITASLMLTACGSSSSAVGFWVIEKVTAGDVEMNADDAKSFGLTAVGSLKLQKWKQAKDGTITVKYDDDTTLKGSIDDKGVMKLSDPQGTEYVLSK